MRRNEKFCLVFESKKREYGTEIEIMMKCV
jgi:hypothetical protein